MNTSYKPESYTSLAPYLIVKGTNATIEFLKHALDAVELRRYEDPDGSVMHNEVRPNAGVMDPGGTTRWIAAQIGA